MLSRTPRSVRVFFHRRGNDPESAWCTPLPAPRLFRLDNILFLHDSPVYGDIVEALPSARFDGQLACKRVVKTGGRFAMIIDYPKAKQHAPLVAFMRKSLGVEAEGSFGPSDGKPGRLYLAVPDALSAKSVFEQAAAKFPGLLPVHPPLGRKKGASPAPAPPPPTKKDAAAAPPTLFQAIYRNDSSAVARLKRADLALLDERKRPLLFLAVLEGRTAFVERLIALGADLNPKKFAPLHAAAMRNRPKEAKLLMAAGAIPSSARDKDGDPILVTAAFRESIAVLRVLLSVPHTVEDKSLALLEAAGVGNLPIVKLLVKHGADPAWKSSHGNSAMSIARKRKRTAVVAYFKSLSEARGLE